MRYYHLGIALLLCACGKKDQPVPVPSGPVTQQEINNWVLDSMRYFYLWNDNLPQKADATMETRAFFQSLKNPVDPFSLIYNPGNFATMPRYMLNNYGMDYSIIAWPAATGSAIGVVKLVIPGSNAATAGFRRGSYFTKINSAALTPTNAATLTEQVLKDGQGIFTPATISGGVVTEGNPVTVLLGIATENPIYAKTIINSNNKKIAYLFYNAFNDAYNNSLISAFQDFKNQGATELILDMRYNTGGSVAAAAVLTALTATGITEKSTFVQYSGNKNQGTQQLSFGATMASPESGSAIAFSSVQSAALALSRVFILTSHETISAAELTINNLKPYTKVIQIGDTTYGKDKGAISIKDGRGRITWIMHPITYKLSNAKGEGNYEKGIPPTYLSDEMNTQPLAAIGDVKDVMITKAISIIAGNGRTAIPESNTYTRTWYVTPQMNSELIIPR
ncbi:C-terminal processing protease CtpA/Prc [Chitinophaga niastensis]|uniref:C-terminal processing protease CtpA/Prc n=1 Tax=Chitinophaga niastensis TaxID=536980 RepID=A0A2P8HU17_CHINA|nr:S41 family peptidase [Chitinophaga niastensis]PSL49730.1 C-terminal processing protease CtpA/Prc [Chitinophaga niastensis]